MHSKRQSARPLLHAIVLTLIAASLITAAMLPAAAQNSVPPTAVQAAKMPQFASHLAPPAKRPAPLNPAARAKSRPGPRDSSDIYDNGPINGNTDAWTIDFGFIVGDTFYLANNGTEVTGMSFGAWLSPGDTLTSAELSITSSPFSGTSYFDQTISFTQGSCTVNEYGYNVCTETASFSGPTLNAGTYWVNLQNASVPSGDPAYWDENSGAGCTGTGCPSQADENSVGTIPSESFTILGSATTTITCATIPSEKPAAQPPVVSAKPSPRQTFQVLYNFTGGPDGAYPTTGLAMDAYGNLYGTASAGGAAGEGTVFKLTPSGSSWRFTSLYSFSGTNGSSPDSSPVVASNGIVYGTTAGGGFFGHGVLFGISPSAHASPNVLSNWTDRLFYSFTGGSDGSKPGGDLVIDASGNIYGTAAGGGTYGGGTLYQFNRGLQVLHNFAGGSEDGDSPMGVVSGQGGLYGVTEYGGTYASGTVYTLAGGYRILYNFPGGMGGGLGNPVQLAADQAGNLYGGATWHQLIHNCWLESGGTLWELFYADWSLNGLAGWGYVDTFQALVTADASGNLYGTVIDDNLGSVFEMTCCWTFTSLHDFSGSDGEYPESAPLVDAQGNIYGTTQKGGAFGYGVVWEISP